MNVELINNSNIEYLKIRLETFKQKTNVFYLAKINAYDFLKIFTVRPAEYDLEKHSALASSFPDESEYYSHLITEDKNRINNKDFQRDADITRINKIKNYLEEEEFAFFPNTIISNCDLINDLENFQINENSTLEDYFSVVNKPQSLCFLLKEKETFFLIVPNKPNTVLVIDGQHRLEGLLKSTVETQKNFDLIITFLIGYDRSVIAKQFYTINYEQKSVNKSLLYQLTGEFSHELDELTFMHNAAKLLNELNESPFFGRIKMLGKAPKNATREIKEKLSISQAFFIDSCINLISSKAKGTNTPPIFLKYYQDPEKHIQIIRNIARFFNAVSKISSGWEYPNESIVSKGMGVTALLRVLNILFPIIYKYEMSSDWNNIKTITVDDYKNILNGLEKVDFSTDGPYGKTGSGGSISKIKNDILSKLNYLEKYSNENVLINNDYKIILDEFNLALNRD